MNRFWLWILNYNKTGFCCKNFDFFMEQLILNGTRNSGPLKTLSETTKFGCNSVSMCFVADNMICVYGFCKLQCFEASDVWI